MKKFILGVLVGVSITAAGSAYADDVVNSIVGKRVDGEFPIKISGKSLDTKAAVLEGTSYLPVRAVGEALNMDVTFNADLGIELTPKGAVTMPETPQSTSTPTQPAKSIQDQIKDLQDKVIEEKKALEDQKALLKINEDSLNNPNIPKDGAQKFIDTYKGIITEIEKRITDYEAQIAALEAQK